jgi:uncharacterized membrane-anchored protein
MSRTLRIALLALGMIAVILAMVAMYARDLKSGTEITLKTEPVDPRSLFLGHYATLGYAINRLDGAFLGGHCYKANDPIFVTLEPDAAGDWRPVRAAPKMPADGFAEGRVTLRGRAQWGGGDCLQAETEAEAQKIDAPTATAPEEVAPEEQQPLDAATEEDASSTESAGAAIEGEDAATEEAVEPLPEPEPFLPTTWVVYGVEQYFASPDAAKRLEELAFRRPTADGEPAPEPLEIILSVPRSGRALIKGVVIDGERVYDQTIW